MNLLDRALEYAELGYKVFPVKAGNKVPYTGDGFYSATTDETQIETMWELWPEANIGITTSGLIAIDIDGANNPWLQTEPDKLLELAQAPVSITPRGGRHYLFRAPEGEEFKCSASLIAPNVDVRAERGYIVAPPSIITDVGEYRWEQVFDLAPQDLPLPPEWLLNLLRSKNTGSWEVTKSGNPIPNGVRHSTLVRIAGAHRRIGLSGEEILASLLSVNDRCVPPLDIREVESIAKSAGEWTPDQVSVAVTEDHWKQEGVVSAIPDDPGPFPKHLLNPGGLLSEITDYLQGTSIRPQPILDIGAAIALMATVIGRKAKDPIGTRSNLLILSLLRSGGGKENGRNGIASILEKVELEELIGPEEIKSDTGLLECVELHPQGVILMLDEIAHLLKAMDDPGKPHLWNITQLIIKLYNRSGGKYTGGAYADVKRTKVINEPFMVLYGTAIPEVFYPTMSREKLMNGFMGRMLVFESGEFPKPKIPKPIDDIPASLLKGVAAWGHRTSGGNLESKNPATIVVPYTKGADKAMNEYQHAADEYGMKSEDEGAHALWVRSAESARKIALIHACCMDVENPVIDKRSVEYATQLVEYLIRRMIYQSSMWVYSSQHEKLRNRVIRLITKRGGEITRTGLTRGLSDITPRQREEVLSSLMQTGTVIEELRTGTATRPAQVIRLTKKNEDDAEKQ